ncbi:MAG TPA: phosphotransferase [Steroidobacteraceae bacterium]|jgi:hypothetical protein
MGVADASDSRLGILTGWVVDDLGFADSRIAPASADASFRRYFRLTRGSESFIVMDAPPDKEDLKPFISVARTLSDVGVNVPLVLARDLERGFLLLTDLGTEQYLSSLTESSVEKLYADALDALLKIEGADPVHGAALPRYDETLLNREMQLLPDWFLERHLGLRLSADDSGVLCETFAALTAAALEQPAAIVHRDYHSRNLLITREDNPGIIDFQDAVWGPVTYDAVSLLKDCYIAWDPQRVHDWALGHARALAARGFKVGSEREYLRWFDLMGLQRHIKVLGIFARLFYRDGKSQYLNDLPRVLAYTQEAAARYPETRRFAQFLAERVVPRFTEAQRRALA